MSEIFCAYDSEGNSYLQRAFVRESWDCFVELIKMGGVPYFKRVNEKGFSLAELAEDQGLKEEYDMIHEEIKEIEFLEGIVKTEEIETLEETNGTWRASVIKDLVAKIKSHRKSSKTTILITDKRCLDHAGFD